MKISQLTEAFGAVVSGVDLGNVDPEGVEEIREAFHKHQVLLFRDQEISMEQHIVFSKNFGPLEVHISKDSLHKDHEEILLVSNVKENGKYIGVENAGDSWHSDLSYMPEPSLGSLLYALEVSEVGGDTEWLNMYAAYDTLPQKTKERIEGLKARHSFNRYKNKRIGVPDQRKVGGKERYAKISPPDVFHPVARTHPETGRKALYVSPRFTLGILDGSDDEAQDLLDELIEHATQRDFVYHHSWKVGDLIMWDNRNTLHLACRGIPEGQIRHMHRTTISGDVPF
ncbi:MAG: taurine dioxygenase [Rhodospirillaceae bacterium]|nr:taurine dioxygenase [Rhodospirillaceae bacterium]|tara:strand:+ start:17509 stop:18360 length:852 start_codon:yes stop_codon:yes gene_type:complete